MENFYIELLIALFPVLLTNLATFLITKYNVTKSKNPEYIKIAYNRIYYPLYYLILNTDDYEKILFESKSRLMKYRKYASTTTLMTFSDYEKYINTRKVNKYCNAFKDDITNYNHKMRISLGYPEPMYISVFSKLSFRKQIQAVYWLLLFVLYASMSLSIILINVNPIISIFLDHAVSYSFVFFLVVALIRGIYWAIYRIPNIFFKIVKRFRR